jgi:hypothetical protein
MKSLGIKTYLPGGQGAASHIHRLVRIDEAPYLYRCVDCGARLQRLYARWPAPQARGQDHGHCWRKPGFARGPKNEKAECRRVTGKSLLLMTYVDLLWMQACQAAGLLP